MNSRQKQVLPEAENDEKFQRALAANPHDHQALNNWGVALFKQARSRQGVGGEAKLYLAACEKYEEALKICPERYDTLYNWGTALFWLARTRDGVEMYALYQEAGEKYSQALKIKPEKYQAWVNWGCTQLHQVRNKAESEKEVGAEVDKE